MDGHDWRTIVRVAAAAFLAVALIVIFARGQDRAYGGSPAFEHPGVIEAYAEAGFQAVVVIGIGVAVYIGTRAGEP